jgi:hypothetical protein
MYFPDGSGYYDENGSPTKRLLQVLATAKVQCVRLSMDLCYNACAILL